MVSAASQPGGFSPGLAARLRTEDGARLFVKAAGPEPNAQTPAAHRREASVAAALPRDAPVPRPLWSHDEGEGGWIVLAFEDVEGTSPAEPWRAEELERVLDALVDLGDLLTPSPLAPEMVGEAGDWSVIAGRYWEKLIEDRLPGLDDWSTAHLEDLAKLEARAPRSVGGDTLLHLDLRADNLILTPEQVLVVDWPHARVGAPWLDLVFFAPSVAMQGGPEPEDLLARHPHARRAEEAALTSTVAAVAGFFTREGLLPAPAGLPTLRAFQAAQGRVARGWLARRTGLA